MKIQAINTYLHPFILTRPYQVAYKMQSSVENIIVEIMTEDGKLGLGAAAPAAEVTQETIDQSKMALAADGLAWCLNRDLNNDFADLLNLCQLNLAKTPAACAAVDMALHDLYAQSLGKPLVEVLGRIHQKMPTSITIGIKDLSATLLEAAEYYDRGFRVLKVKLGCELDQDIERCIKLRERYGSNIILRVDPNQGYSLQDLRKFMAKTRAIAIEFIEQPLKANDIALLQELTAAERSGIALDESLLTPQQAIAALQPEPSCGIFNIKLMKCGGIYASRQIATIAQAANIKLMWGCMDESIISIAAALHVAFASPATHYLDLDGSLDLGNDLVTGGFHLEDGMMSTLDAPGLGVQKI